ncbi:MAG: hypothetical protein FWD61_07935 [Phycisphaerales bacterium]|nr:hypothetical protein [Phycisphaerales bacterium]
MVNSNREENKRTVRVLVAQLMAGACLVTALTLSGCDSATSEANKKAQKQANEAARIAGSAGDLRPTDKFANDLAGKDKAEQDRIGKEAADAIKADDKNAKGVWKTYLEQRTAAEDLKISLDKVNEAVKTPELADSGLKAALQAQVGMTAAAQTQVKLQEMETKFTQLVQKVIDMQTSASYLEDLGNEAVVLEKRAQLGTPPGTVKVTVEDAKAQVAKAQAAVTDLQNQITTKEQRALQVYAETDAAMAAADNMPGLQAIEHAKKAVEARKEADNLRAEVLNLQPQLSQAKLDLAVSQIRQSQAEAEVEGNTTAAERSKAASQIAADHAAAMRKNVQELMKDKGGLEEMAADFTKMAEELKKQANEAVASGSAAATAYKAAQQAWSAQQTEILKLKEDPKMDAVVRAWSSRDMYQLLQLAEATAKEQVGRAYLLQVLAERYRGMANIAMATAQKAAGISTETAATAPDESNLAAKAKGEFMEANRIVDSVVPPGTSSGDSATGPARAMKWLGFTLKAVGSHGIYTLSDGKDQDALKAAQDAAKKAKELNPFLKFGMTATAG